MIYDISMPLTPAMPVWPGDPAFSIDFQVAEGVTVSRVSMGVHTGTHVDAPLHFYEGGKPLDKISLERWMGMVRVIDVPSDFPVVTEALLRNTDLRGVFRILLKTANSTRCQLCFDRKFVGLDATAAQYLVDQKISMIGNDYLSVEPFSSNGMVHKILLQHDVLLLEGIRLGAVPPGDYLLICLPLLIPGAEAAPVRAVLIEKTDLENMM